MSDKWADYAISAVRYDEQQGRILSLCVRSDNGTDLSVAKDVPTAEVVSLIEDGYTFVTIFEGDGGRWRRGADVMVATIKGRRYLCAVPNGLALDDLGGLPRR